MKFAIPIIAIVLSAIAAYFTLTQAEKFGNLQDDRLEKGKMNVRVLANLTETEDNIEIEQERLKEAEQKLLVAKSELSEAESSGNAVQNEIAGLDPKLNTQDKQFEQLNEQLGAIKQQLGALGDGIDASNLSSKFEELEATIVQKREKIEELDALISGAEKNLNAKTEESQQLKERIRARNQRIALNEMEARITAVNHEWGFVVIAAGSNSGFSPRDSLLVKRSGELIGRVNPSAIEPTQTIAEIDLKSLAPGVRIQPGDQVILARPAVN